MSYVTCDRCIFWRDAVVCRPHGEATEWVGECRRLAPRQDVPRWPTTLGTEGCGQGEAKA